MKISLTNTINETINFAQISFERFIPKSTQFDDIYFSDAGGIEETKHVFIKGNFLEERFNEEEFDDFVILETGFGTGSNLLVLLNFYKELKNKPKHISFLSFEKFPLTKEDFIKSLESSPLKEEAQILINAYTKNPLVSGLNEIKINDNFTLYLVIGDLAETISLIDLTQTSKIDAIFLDGFSPKQNPQMWSSFVLKHIYDLSKEGTTLATFTVARIVRDNLSSANFSLSKAPGFGRKREMLIGKKV